MPTNVNGLINTIWLILGHHNKQEGVSKDNIKNKLRELNMLDFHIFYKSGVESFTKYRSYWITRMTRVMNIYRFYLEDILAMFGCENFKTFEDDIEYTIIKIFGIKISVNMPAVERAFIYDHDYIMDYVTDKQDDICFNVYCAIAADELDKFIPRVYGYRLQSFGSVENRAGVKFALPFKTKKCIEKIWNSGKNEAKLFLHDTMWYYFDDYAIDNLIRYLYKHVKSTPHCGILCENNNNLYIFKDHQYTTVGNEYNLDYCKQHVKDFIEACYKC